MCFIKTPTITTTKMAGNRGAMASETIIGTTPGENAVTSTITTIRGNVLTLAYMILIRALVSTYVIRNIRTIHDLSRTFTSYNVPPIEYNPLQNDWFYYPLWFEFAIARTHAKHSLIHGVAIAFQLFVQVTSLYGYDTTIALDLVRPSASYDCCMCAVRHKNSNKLIDRFLKMYTVSTRNDFHAMSLATEWDRHNTRVQTTRSVHWPKVASVIRATTSINTPTHCHSYRTIY